MDENFLYQQIAESIRQDMLGGKLQPGDRLPSVREMAKRWDCTIGTVQRAYKELAKQGLLISRSGQGTRIAAKPGLDEEIPLRRAALIHRAEAFLLEVLTSGYQLYEVEDAVRIAMDHWRAIEQIPPVLDENVLRFVGSHDMVVTWLSAHFMDIVPGYRLQLGFSGSLGGLIALAEGKADLAGSHLWDPESDTYNAKYVRRLLPGKRVALLTLAHRRLELICPPGNPAGIQGLQDLTRQDIRFVNRQSGSGTRVWTDSRLQEMDISVERINGYDDERLTHSDIALTIANKAADVGIGLEASARAYGLDFIELTLERYDLIFCESQFKLPSIQSLIQWLGGSPAREAISSLAGYDTRQTGRLEWV